MNLKTCISRKCILLVALLIMLFYVQDYCLGAVLYKKKYTTEFSFILKPSTISGIGIFATHDIPIGTSLFSGSLSSRKMNSKDVPSVLLQYCIFLDKDKCLCPRRFDRMEIIWFLNHSKKPNIKKTSYKKIIAISNIKAGEEILIDYNEFNEPDNLKDYYYKK